MKSSSSCVGLSDSILSPSNNGTLADLQGSANHREAIHGYSSTWVQGTEMHPTENILHATLDCAGWATMVVEDVRYPTSVRNTSAVSDPNEQVKVFTRLA
jgi:hypothetical protein